jgi:hypothetical protein
MVVKKTICIHPLMYKKFVSGTLMIPFHSKLVLVNKIYVCTPMLG